MMKFGIIFFFVLLSAGCNLYSAIVTLSGKATNNLSYQESAEEKGAIISMTKAYEIAATRIANKMLDDTADIYEAHPKSKLYINKIVKKSETLPDGLYSAQKSLKEIISGSGTYTVVDKAEDADFILESNVSEVKNATQPTVLFSMNIKDNKNNSIKAWSITIRQMSEDKSWW